MNKTDFNSLYTEKYHSKSADVLKFWLMPFVFFVLFGFPTKYGSYISTLSNFAAPAFFILSGFFILTTDDAVRRKKLKNAIKRYFIFFAVLFAVYTLISIVYLSYIEADWVPEIIRKRTFFNFFVINIWPLPIGASIWFIQSLLYASIILLLADKSNLLKKAFIYIPVFIILVALMLFGGEFSALVGFPYFGYDFIPGGALTRALPYMLIGMFIRKHANRILNIRRFFFPLLFITGLFLAILELNLLSHFSVLRYTGHMIGFGIMAFSVCCFALSKTDSKMTFLSSHGKNFTKRMYAFAHPVYLVFMLLTGTILGKYFIFAKAFGSIFVFIICFIIAYAIGVAKFAIVDIKKFKNK